MLKVRPKLVGPWDPTSATLVQSSRCLFATIGSHANTGCIYGLSLSVVSSCSEVEFLCWRTDHLQNVQNINAKADINTKFDADINFRYQGLVVGGSFNASINSTDQYTNFSNNIHEYKLGPGGDPTLASEIISNPQDKQSFSTFEE